MYSTKLVFFGPIGKNKMAGLASDWLRHFRLLLWNLTKLDRKQDLNNLLPSLCFRADRKKQDGRPGLWLAETFSTSLKPLNWFIRNLTGSNISMSSTKFVFFELIGKNDRPVSDWLWHFRLFLWNHPPWGPGVGVVENVSFISTACRKGRLNGAVSRNNSIKKVAPCRCLDGHFK